MLNESPQVAAIRARYKTSFNDKKDLVDDYVDQLTDQPHGEEVLSELHSELHKLAGSSGMYGYDDISLVCRGIMKNISDNDSGDVLNDLNKLSELFNKYLNKDD